MFMLHVEPMYIDALPIGKISALLAPMPQTFDPRIHAEGNVKARARVQVRLATCAYQTTSLDCHTRSSKFRVHQSPFMSSTIKCLGSLEKKCCIVSYWFVLFCVALVLQDVTISTWVCQVPDSARHYFRRSTCTLVSGLHLGAPGHQASIETARRVARRPKTTTEIPIFWYSSIEQ
jgi:hypothetical protein